ncbi:HxlR family transcriptional regulator [Streptomyces sp. 3211.6]|uniref:winged helix-turn-helix transcriptional regulator n=1 Tax=Streptomyces TaxID=1883 RepID=UPI0009A48FAE|nr:MULTISPECIES: helix-turn-helix domain-containing protein [Streptomyces]RKT06219.1 HxlR family transcriptional regulator [Streptomyces sp. 3211.6]RPF46244.1 HxlR family transcriptional regulator [Streptomyces sp. Ag109_G2-6]
MTLPPLDPEMFDPVCPSTLVPFRVGDKWAPLILRCLEGGPRRFSELKVPLRGITSKSLTQSLRGLERDGFVTREESGDGGPERRVEYALTLLGRGLLGPLDAACAWTREHWDELIDAREEGLAAAAAQPQVREQSTRR